MMEQKTSVIRHPASNPFVIRREWTVRAVRRSRPYREGVKFQRREELVECAAEILSIMEYHTNNPSANALWREAVNRAKIKSGELRETAGWMPYSANYMQHCLCGGRGRVVIGKALEALYEIRFIDINTPKDIIEFYATGIVGWYKLEVDTINKWIDLNYGVSIDLEDKENGQDFKPKPKPETPDVKLPSAPAQKSKSEQNNMAVKLICAFHRHIHRKNASYIYDDKRKKPVLERITKDKRRLGQLAQAIIGNTFSPHHQGRNPKTNPYNTIYDDIENICRSAKHFEMFVEFAENKGVTEEIAMRELEAFQQGRDSRYMKAEIKEAPKVVERKRDVSEGVPPEIIQRYKKFASGMSSHFFMIRPLSEIFSLYREDKELVELGRGLTDEDLLYAALMEAIRIFKPDLTGDFRVLISKFCKAFTEMQRINK